MNLLQELKSDGLTEEQISSIPKKSLKQFHWAYETMHGLTRAKPIAGFLTIQNLRHSLFNLGTNTEDYSPTEDKSYQQGPMRHQEDYGEYAGDVMAFKIS